MARSSPERFFESLVAGHDAASRTFGGSTSVRLTIADRPITLEIAGPTLTSLIMPALAHLVDNQSDATERTFSIRVFESAGSGVAVDPPPWGAYDYLARGEIRGYNDQRFRTVYRTETGTLSMMDVDQRVAMLWVRDLRHYPTWKVAAPLRTILSWWAAAQGLQLAHGASVGRDGRGVLITAPGGSGKSTTAIRCALEGFDYVGDDYVLLDPHALMIHSVYSSAKADDGAVDEYFPQLRSKSRGRIHEDVRGKHVFFASDLFPDRIATSFQLSAVVVPGFSPQSRSSFRAGSPATALAALAPTTVFQLAGSTGRDMRTLATILRRVPCFELAIAAKDNVSVAIQSILDQTLGPRT